MATNNALLDSFLSREQVNKMIRNLMDDTISLFYSPFRESSHVSTYYRYNAEQESIVLAAEYGEAVNIGSTLYDCNDEY